MYSNRNLKKRQTIFAFIILKEDMITTDECRVKPCKDDDILSKESHVYSFIFLGTHEKIIYLTLSQTKPRMFYSRPRYCYLRYHI